MRNSRWIRYAVVLACGLSGSASVKAGDFWDAFKWKRGSGTIVTEERQVEAFGRIRSTGWGNIYITIGNPQRVTVSFDDNLIDMIKTDVRAGRLEIETDGSFSSESGYRIEITVPELREIENEGSGDIELIDYKGETFAMSLSGSGDYWLSGEFGQVAVNVSGSGDGEIEGSADELEVTVSGSGDLDARDLTAGSAWIQVSGSGSAQVHATEELDASVSGSGDIVYYGRPEQISTNVSGSGSIRRK